MRTTRIEVTAAQPRAKVALTVGAFAPRLVTREGNRVTVALAASQMIIIGGDQVRVEILVGTGCELMIEDIGGTICYPRPVGVLGRSRWELDITVEPGATLTWHGLPCVITDDASLDRSTRVELGEDARAVIRETVILGRHGEVGGDLRQKTLINDSAGPVLAELLEVSGYAPAPGLLGSHKVLDTVTAVGFRPSTRPGDLIFAEPGASARFLGSAYHRSGLPGVWHAWLDDLRSAGSEPPLGG